MCTGCTNSALISVPQEQIDAAAEKGATLLDERKSDWFAPERLNSDHLDLGTWTDCVLGQNFGDYSTGLEALGLTFESGIEYGFSLPDGVRGESWMRLTETWKAQIAKRREAPVAA